MTTEASLQSAQDEFQRLASEYRGNFKAALASLLRGEVNAEGYADNFGGDYREALMSLLIDVMQ